MQFFTKKKVFLFVFLSFFYLYIGSDVHALPPLPVKPGVGNGPNVVVPSMPDLQKPPQPQLPPCPTCNLATPTATPSATESPRPIGGNDESNNNSQNNSSSNSSSGSSSSSSGTGGGTGGVLGLSSTSSGNDDLANLSVVIGLLCASLGVRILGQTFLRN